MVGYRCFICEPRQAAAHLGAGGGSYIWEVVLEKLRRLSGYRATAAIAAVLGLGLLSSAAVQAQANKTVTIVVGEEPDDLDPCSASSSFTGRVIHQNVVETLAELRPNGDIEPLLASGWEQTNPLTWRYKLRQGVTFHDGAKLDADAVLKAFNRVQDVKFMCMVKSKYFSTEKVTATKVDDYTVDFSTAKPWPLVLIYMTGLGIPSPNTPSDKLQLTAIGTGPYMLDHWTQQQEIVLKKNPDYWNKAKKLEVEVAKYVIRKESPVRASMVEVGEADLAPEIAVNDATNPKTDIHYPNSETTWLRIDMTQPPLDDKRVRQALNYAIDRKALMENFFARGSVAATQAWGPNVKGHNFDIDKKPWPYDPAKAKALLAEAKAAGVKVDTEIELQGRMAVYDRAEELMEAVYQYYTAVGFKVKLKMYEVAQWRRLHVKPYPEPRPPALLQAIHDNATGDAGFSAVYKHACEATSGTLCDPHMDKVIAEANQMTGAARAKAFEEVARLSYEEYVDNVYLVHMVSFSRIGKRIKYEPNVLTRGMLKIEDISFN